MLSAAAAVDSPSRLHRIGAATISFDRNALLRTLGIDFAFPQTGDFAGIKSLSLQGVRPIKVHESKVPFLDAGSALDCCSGATLFKWAYTTVVAPCYSMELVPDTDFCQHCTELWGTKDEDDGNFLVSKDSAAVSEFYAPGETIVITNWSGFKELKESCHDLITDVKG